MSGNYWLDAIERDKNIRKLLKEKEEDQSKKHKLLENIKGLIDHLRAKGKI